MPDLWKALGDVYGEAGPDTRPVATERSAEARFSELTTSLPLDDDLAAALSAALVDGPRTPPPASSVTPPAVPAPQPVQPAPPVITAQPVPPLAPQPVPAPQPVRVAPVANVAVATAPAPAPAPLAAPQADAIAAGGAGERVSAWLADINERQRLREQGPDLDAVIPDTPVWQRGDDDILPAAAKKSRRRG